MKKLKFVLFPLFCVVIALVFCACARAEVIKVPQAILDKESFINDVLRNTDGTREGYIKYLKEIQGVGTLSIDFGLFYKDEAGNVVYEATEKERKKFADYIASRAQNLAESMCEDLDYIGNGFSPFDIIGMTTDPEGWDAENYKHTTRDDIKVVWTPEEYTITCTQASYDSTQDQWARETLDELDVMYQWLTTGNYKSRMQINVVEGETISAETK